MTEDIAKAIEILGRKDDRRLAEAEDAARHLGRALATTPYAEAREIAGIDPSSTGPVSHAFAVAWADGYDEAHGVDR